MITVYHITANNLKRRRRRNFQRKEIRGWPREKKIALIESANPEGRDLNLSLRMIKNQEKTWFRN
jgi:predicted GIY-YIG superfamily endonuclease